MLSTPLLTMSLSTDISNFADRRVLDAELLDAAGSGAAEDPFRWTPLIVLRVAGLFLLAGLAEIGGEARAHRQ